MLIGPPISKPIIDPSKSPKRKAIPRPRLSFLRKIDLSVPINLSKIQPIGAPIIKIAISDQKRLTPIGITKIGIIPASDFCIFRLLRYFTL